VALEPLELTIRPGRTGGMGGAGSHTLHRSRLIRYPDAPRNRSTRASPRGTGLALAFRTLLSFQGTSPGCSSATRSRFPRRGPVAGAAGTVPRACRGRQRPPTRTGAYSLRSAARHVGAVTQKRRPAPGLSWASGRPPKPSDRILLAFGDLLSSVADAAGVVPERSSVSKNFPACSPEKVAPYATVCQLADANNGNGSSVVAIPGRPRRRTRSRYGHRMRRRSRRRDRSRRDPRHRTGMPGGRRGTGSRAGSAARAPGRTARRGLRGYGAGGAARRGLRGGRG
jgi:hypothetical protein